MSVEGKIKSLITVVILLNVIVIILGVYLLGLESEEIYKIGTLLNLFSLGVFYAINYFFWKVNYINKLFGSIPNLNGEWEGTIVNKKDGKEQKSKLIITQTWFNVKVETKVERGNSSTVSSEIININDTWKLYFVWEASFDGSPFDGTTIVRIEDNELDGLYYTNANFNESSCTVGTFKAKRKGKINYEKVYLD